MIYSRYAIFMLCSSTSTLAFNGAKKKWEEEMKAAMQENERQLTEMKQTYEERLKQQIQQEQKDKTNKEFNDDKDKIETLKISNPYLSNLNFDEQLSGKICHIIGKGTNSIGKADECSIKILGPSIHDHHAIIHRTEKGKVILEKSTEDCRILLNGDPVANKVHLSHNDRILFGTTQLFVFIHPDQKGKSNMTFSEVTFELAQEEIATKQGFEMNNSEDQTIEQAILNKDLLEVIPAVDEANGISEELEKNVRFEIILVSSQFLGKTDDRTEV